MDPTSDVLDALRAYAAGGERPGRVAAAHAAEAIEERDRLRAAIETHRDTHADTLAYRRDAALYAALRDH